ncbi:MAG TPA: hypothetical protein VFN78_06280 [Ktedonobacterales bacterium]|nr:hypothetical protein [Ktedonobacterales bacterium]
MNRPSKFSFIDESEAVRRLDVDRDTLLGFVREKRLKAFPGVGKGNFYRLSDVDALANELRPQHEAPEEAASGAEQPPAKGKLFDPAYKVHVRLQADLKWYDLSDDDLRAWVREMTADGYNRQRANITMVIERLQRLVALMDESVASWQELKPTQPPSDQQQ